MKVIRKLLSFVAFSLILMLVSCNVNLVAPTNLSLNSETNKLLWDEVKGADSYLVSANEVLYMTNENEFNLDNLEDGNYTIKVQAKRNNDSSPWSDLLKVNYSKSSTLNIQKIPGSNEYMVIGVGGFKGDNLVIPDSYKDAPITIIGESAFESYANIKTITLGNNVNRIEKNAFKNMVSLTNVTFNEGLLEIAESAFQGDLLLKEISLPDSIKSLGAYAFAYNKSLTKVKLPNQLKVVPKKSFQECIKLENIEIPSSVLTIEEYAFARNISLKNISLSSNLKELGNSSFYETKMLKSITIPGSVKVIEPFAFSKSGVKEVNILEGVEVIEKQAFYEARDLASVSLPKSLKSIKSFAFDETKLVNGSESIYIGEWLIKEQSDKSDIVIKNGTIGMAGSSIRDNNNIRSVTLPSSLKIIGEYNFYKMDNLISLNLSDTSVEVIEEAAINNVISLNVTSLPSTLKSVGQYVFMKTINTTLASDYIVIDKWLVGHKDPTIKTINIPNNIIGISDYAFDNFRNVESVNISGATNLIYIGEASFNALTKVNSLSIPNSVKRIGKYAFANMTKLTSITLPINLKVIEQSTFYGDLNLREVDFPLDLYKIEKYAFYETNIKELVLPSNVEILESGAFYSNATLTSLTLNDGLRIIGSYAFSKAMYLKELTIPSSVEVIEDHAFFGAKNLETLDLGSVYSIGDYAFYDTNKLKHINFGNSLEIIGNYAFSNNDELTSLNLPSSLRHIGEFSFASFANLKSIVIPKSVDYIGDFAFEYIDNLAIYLEGDLNNKHYSSLWNSKYAPILTNCILSSDGSYVKAYVKKEEIINNNSFVRINAPTRDGYIFTGWSKTIGDEKLYSMDELKDIPLDTILYANYKKKR